ncbi:hypothetical protein SALB1_2616 [Salinisphaera sp. LB1]|nr:hypothetical protein SALB1_2616 [Salinisphaera sp. LB1]
MWRAGRGWSRTDQSAAMRVETAIAAFTTELYTGLYSASVKKCAGSAPSTGADKFLQQAASVAVAGSGVGRGQWSRPGR